ncbi:MAG: 1-deoxy-D-xylulose-5-phosphate synthase [Candidatus Omnitrophica bacterium]|nr:1-deoxy-D-xylulose-5-phosphate synthase [Candidatus Omnitrophota bacterium]
MGPLLEKVNSPEDLKELSLKELTRLSKEIGDYILEVVSTNGGHLGAALGAVDLTVALHYCFTTPYDTIVWDVGHQAHAHKILTGRKEAFRSFRQEGGISGFSNKEESRHDPFTTGHGGASLSTALGIAVANRLLARAESGQKLGRGRKVIAVIGDASIVSGMAFEALNHAGHLKEDLLVILNDNEMSISPTVGALSRHLNKILSNPFYNRVRKDIEKFISGMPKVGSRMIAGMKRIDEGLKNLLVPGLFFEELGFRYFGPLDGHNVEGLVQILKNISIIQKPVLLHVVTKKGKGYPIAEADPVKWHASTPFCLETGEPKKSSTQRTYTQVFGETAVKLAGRHPGIAAITAAMCEGTGLVGFAKEFPERFFDVGIAEEHAVSFAAGLARAGVRPLAAIYSTFLQRSHDQIIHDVALQNLPVVFCVDRAGLVGEDGPTHHGVFDIAYLRKVPNMVLMAPRDGRELERMLDFAAEERREGPLAIRYPRGAVMEESSSLLKEARPISIQKGKAEVLKEGGDALFLAFGSMVYPAYEAALLLEKENVQVTVVNARFAKPLDEELILRLAGSARLILTLEEGTLLGGFGSAVLELLERRRSERQNGPLPRTVTLGIPDRFVEHGKREKLLDSLGLSPSKIKERVLQELKSSDALICQPPIILSVHSS